MPEVPKARGYEEVVAGGACLHATAIELNGKRASSATAGDGAGVGAGIGAGVLVLAALL